MKYDLEEKDERKVYDEEAREYILLESDTRMFTWDGVSFEETSETPGLPEEAAP